MRSGARCAQGSGRSRSPVSRVDADGSSGAAHETQSRFRNQARGYNRFVLAITLTPAQQRSLEALARKCGRLTVHEFDENVASPPSERVYVIPQRGGGAGFRITSDGQVQLIGTVAPDW